MRYVALLRGINVGGNMLVPMSKLKAMFEELGFDDVTTYINSGNVIFSATGLPRRKLEAAIEDALEKEFHAPIRVVVKSKAEMRRVVEAMPPEWLDTKTWRGNVIFLSHRIDKPSLMKDLRPNAKIETAIHRHGALLWGVRWKDVTKSHMIRRSSATFYKEMTVRNPNTTRKILELMER